MSPPAETGREPVEIGPEPVDAGFDALYSDEWAGLVALGWSLTGSWAEAEDLVQDAFADAHRRWDHVGGLDRPGAWVRRAVINRAASMRRHRSAARRGRARLGSLLIVDGEGRGDDRTGEAAVGRVADPVFWAAVRSLPERQAAAIALRYLEDRSIVEIAGILGCRPGTVKAHLHRGRRSLAKLLEERWGPDGRSGGRSGVRNPSMRVESSRNRIEEDRS